MKVSKIVFTLLVSISFLLPVTLAADSGGRDAKGCAEMSGLMIIGEAENVTFIAKKLRLKARIDTGATTSSLGALDLKPFERDGKKWIRFTIKDPVIERYVDFEKPVARIAEIKRHGAAAQERPVVKLKVMMGEVEMEREFSLTDRSRYNFPVLIGRNVLRGKFLVDVNRKFSTRKSGGNEE